MALLAVVVASVAIPASAPAEGWDPPTTLAGDVAATAIIGIGPRRGRGSASRDTIRGPGLAVPNPAARIACVAIQINAGRVRPAGGTLLAGLLLAIVALSVMAAPARAQTFQVGLPSDCSAARSNWMNPNLDLCLLVENRTRQYGVQGTFNGMSLKRTDVKMSKGFWDGGSSSATSPGSFWSRYGPGGTGLLGVVSYAPATGPLAGTPVQIQVGESGSETRLAQCINVRYFACEIPETTQPPAESNILGQFPVAVAIVENRPVILKIINQTDQPLRRSTDLRLTGFVQDTASTNDALALGIAALQRSQQGQAYYHLFRDLSVDNNATVEYQFAAGGTDVLTGGIIGISLTIDRNGVATGTCNPPQGLLVNVSCAVRVLGEPNEGPTIAIVSVAV